MEWQDLEPRLERSFEGGGRIVDHFEVVGRTRLILTRTVEIGRMRDLEMVFAYDRADDGSSSGASGTLTEPPPSAGTEPGVAGGGSRRVSWVRALPRPGR